MFDEEDRTERTWGEKAFITIGFALLLAFIGQATQMTEPFVDFLNTISQIFK